MYFRKSVGKSVFVLGNNNHVNMIVHKAISPYFQSTLFRVSVQKIQIKSTIVIGKEYVLAPVASLSDMMRNTGNNNTSYASHTKIITEIIKMSIIKLCVPGITGTA
jgi:hypothetical protein